MGGNDFVWVGSIIIGMTVVAWLVLDWLESAQKWDTYQTDGTNGAVGNAEHSLDPLDVEMELMLCYPLDPFAPSLAWRPVLQDQWIEGQEQEAGSLVAEVSPASLQSKAI
jgi:hypothetical protein